MPITFNEKVNEQSTSRLKVTLKDFDNNVIPDTNITSAVLTLKHKETGVTIASQSDIDISGEFDVNGILTHLFKDTHNVIVDTDPASATETHQAILVISAIVSGSTATLTETVEMDIRDLKNV